MHDTDHTAHRDIVDALHLAGAAPRRVLELDGGRALALWHNHMGEAHYERPRHHALSIYTRSGEKTTRQVNGRAVSQGFPGAVCLFPAGSQSQWKIAGPFEFVHLYFNDLDLRRCAEQTWDCEPDRVQLAERYQVEDGIIAQTGKLIDMGDWGAPGQTAAADHLTHWLLVQIVSRHATIDRPLPAVSGTLGPKHRRLLQERIEARLDQPLNLATLAGWVNLSPYHFARLFRATFGCAPYQYLQERRLIRASDMLRRPDVPVTTIALNCGFNDASQFSRAFRKRFGMTPTAYRASGA